MFPTQIDRIMAFDVEKQRVLEKKLRDRFLSNIETEFIQLHALRSGQTVSSFRTVYLRDSLVASLRQVGVAWCAVVLCGAAWRGVRCGAVHAFAHSVPTYDLVGCCGTGPLPTGW